MPTKPPVVNLVAVIGDMVQSRALSANDRARAQREFTELVKLLNQRFRKSIASKFVVTIGDEFQGLLTTAEVVPELTWTVEADYAARQIRMGVGAGVLHTPIQASALNIDGPVLHEARAAITIARDRRMLGGVFKGFGEHDAVLTGYAQVLRFMRSRWTDRQREVVGLIREGLTQVEAAQRLGVSKQAVSDHAVAAGCDAYKWGETGWRQALRTATGIRGRDS